MGKPISSNPYHISSELDPIYSYTIKLPTLSMDLLKFIKLTGSSSTSNLTNSTSVNLAAMAMNAGSIILQGPHQDAEKSTTSFSPTVQKPNIS